MKNLTILPDGLPTPEDDGACQHLIKQPLPNLFLASTLQTKINLSNIRGWMVLFCYPMTGKPDTPLPSGWNDIPGARGCTPQNCAFRDLFSEFSALKTQVFGLSTQTTNDQLEASTRLHLPFSLLSDNELAFSKALTLPTFTFNQRLLNKRVTLIAYDGIIQHYFYPVFPPTEDAMNAIHWLKTHV